ncbi:MAG: ATP-binding protein, partial [Nitrosopumilaceae archaeon]
EKDSLILYVKDNGIGIPKAKQNDLFKKFYQIDTSERRKAGGTGLGLAISKGIMENLGGTIWVESDGKTGTAFYLKLPLEE